MASSLQAWAIHQMDRRTLLQTGLIGSGVAIASAARLELGRPTIARINGGNHSRANLDRFTASHPSSGMVAGFGMSRLRKPGTWEPRDFDVEIGVELDGTGAAQQLKENHTRRVRERR